MKYIVALDQGTTSSRAVVVNQNGDFIAAHGIEFPQIYPKAGWVEHDPFDILSTQKEALRLAVRKAGVSPGEIFAVGVTNQRETTLLWEKETGRPLCNAIVWQCRRTADRIERLLSDGLDEMVRGRTGLVPDAYFSATKLGWMLDNIPGAREKARNGSLCFGTVDSWLIYNMTRDKRHITDDTNASRTMLYNLRNGGWDEELLRLFDIPEAVLPRIVPSSGVAGMLDSEIFGREIPIASIAGDQHAALFGQACFHPGMVKNTYGTGCFLLMNTGRAAVDSKSRLLSTVAWSFEGKREFALEGSIFVAGAGVQWLRDEMGLIQNAAESESVALSIDDTQGVYFVPAFTGMGAPHWDMYARGAVLGMTRGTGRAHIVRAVLESIALQTVDVVRAMERDSGMNLREMRVDGGASANDFLMRFQADILGVRVLRPVATESTAMGAAYMAGMAMGLWSDQKEIESLWHESQTYEPKTTDQARREKLRGWNRAVERAKSWAEKE